MNFLIIRFSSLGDIIQTTAFAHTLKKLYPNSRVAYVTKDEFAEILQGQPFIDKVYSFDKDKGIKSIAKEIGKYDCVFDLHVNIRSLLLTFFLKPKCLKRVNKNTIYRFGLVLHSNFITKLFPRNTVDNIQEQLKLINVNDNTEEIKPILYVKAEKQKKRVGMAVGARWKTKMWPKEYFKGLSNLLTKNGFEVALFGSKDEVYLGEYVADKNPNIKSYVGKLSLKETMKEMATCEVFVSNDSGLMHLASALNIPLVAIFGPTVKGFGFCPRGKSIVLETDLNCRPCSLHGTDRCKRNDLKCMNSIKPTLVYETLMKLIEK